jgi:LysM repeat protein
LQRRFKFAQIIFLPVFLFTCPVSAFGEDIHTVKKNETIYSIAISYGVSMDALIKLNNITDPKRLRTGQKLRIPEKLSTGAQGQNQAGAAYREYVAIKGDTLFSLARKNNTTVAAIRAANRFSESYVLKAGDKLKIPVVVPEKPQTISQNPMLPQSQTAQITPQISVQGNDGPLPKYSNTTWPVEVRSIAKAEGKLENGVIVTSYASEPVRSLTGGIVKAAGPYFNFRNVVVVESKEGYLYTYGGCERLSVKVGDQVGVGTELGRLDTSKDPQLLLIVTKDNKPVNPQTAPRR